ncbi:hypothetical protein NC661_04480 [Aquibacillus koreensis]|uniref:Uncharacterized protein n=1 Tax=Aquibacillus koreensis TaxID=279446 RepID=A0A9X4AIQ2_9BACI|nr:hypothetical protein [Aquibacillus koreensis]MCT2534769.1 hypothetical protein [Aquibacillus koreensis]MDC3419620.1 hypothetical protein [Aquibacillus koreensis]
MIVDINTKKTDNVFGAVWLSTLLLTYNEIEIEKSNEIYFSQTAIQDLAQKICTKTVHNARISQWCNGDHPNNNYNYLRASGPKRRLTRQGEYLGDKEYPDRLFSLDTIIIETANKEVSYRELLEWYRTTYSRIDLVVE